MQGAVAQAEFPSKLSPIFRAIRYKIMFGGRGGAKSHTAARALLTMGIERKLRILCAREIMHTIKESVYQLLLDSIEALGYGNFYKATKTEIIGANGTQIIFTGLQALTVTNIKSFESVDICWVEEGQVVRKASWDILIPTIRKNGSEIWVTFNPELDSDNTYKRFVEQAHAVEMDADLAQYYESWIWVQEVNYYDNPWFPMTLEMERKQAEATMSKEDYEHIWLGKTRASVVGAIYAAEVYQMIRDKRYRSVPYDPRLRVDTIWDLGWNDQNSIVFAQRLQSEVRVINYLEASFLTYAQWVKVLDKLPYAYGTDWLPWDGGIKRQDTGMSAKQQLRRLGRKAQVIPQHEKETRITATRGMFPRVYMDNSEETVTEIEDGIYLTMGCGRLMECLKRYKRNVPTTTEEPTTPMHDQYSHGADAYGGLAMIVDKITNTKSAPPKIEAWSPAVKGVM